MKLLFLTENFPPEVNATASRVYERAVYWARSGHDVTILTGFPNFPQGKIYPGYRQRLIQREWIDGIRVMRVPTYVAPNEGVVRRTLDMISFMVSAIVASIFLPRPDVVAATSPQFFCAVAGWIIGMLKRRPFVLELGDLWPASITAVGAMRPSLALRLVEKLELFLYRRATAIAVLTPAFKRNLVRRGIAPEKIAVVINGVDLPRYAPRARDVELAAETGLSGRFVVGYVGTHGLAHALENAVRAARLLKQGLADFSLLLVGDGAMKPRLRALARELRADNVVFVDPQPKAAMPRWWSLCDAALVHLKNDPVFSEVIPSKIFEAMAMGLPIVLCGPEGEASHIIRHEAAGLCCGSTDPAELAGAIESLYRDRQRLASCATASLAAAPRYSRRRQADDMLKVIEAAHRGHGAHVANVLDAE